MADFAAPSDAISIQSKSSAPSDEDGEDGFAETIVDRSRVDILKIPVSLRI